MTAFQTVCLGIGAFFVGIAIGLLLAVMVLIATDVIRGAFGHQVTETDTKMHMVCTFIACLITGALTAWVAVAW